MSRGSIRPGLEGKPSGLDGLGKGRRHLHRIARFGHGGVEQHGVIAHLHGLGRMRGRADSGIDDERDIGEIGAERLERVLVDQPARRTDRRGPWHQHGAARGDQALGGAQILGGIGKNLEAVGRERGRGLDQAEQVGLQRVVIGDHFELDPIGAEQLARHLARWRSPLSPCGSRRCSAARGSRAPRSAPRSPGRCGRAPIPGGARR